MCASAESAKCKPQSRTHKHTHLHTHSTGTQIKVRCHTAHTRPTQSHIVHSFGNLFSTICEERQSVKRDRRRAVVSTIPYVLQQQQQTPAGIVFAVNDICPKLNREMCIEIFSHWFLISVFVNFSFRQRYCKAGTCPILCADSAHSFRPLAWMSPFLRLLQLPSIAIGP